MMNRRAKYFDSGGREIAERDALDSSGVLRSGFSLRVPTMMRDADPRGRSSSDARPLITDGRTDDPAALHRPGFRVPVVNDCRAVRDAYAKYETGLVNAYRIGDGVQCSECFGGGADEDGETCATCHGRGTVSARERSTGEGFGSGNEGHRSEDSRSVTRDQAYRDYDQALSSAWQNGRTG